MGLQLMMLFGEILAAMAATAIGQALPGCKDRCGNISIPYPFGIGEGCYNHPWLNLSCNESNHDLKIFNSSFQVADISLDGQVRIFSRIGHVCYNSSGSNASYTLQLPKNAYALSTNLNKLTVVGCDSSGSIELGDKYATGCSSKCDSLDYVSSGNCSGFGCCQASIPEKVEFYNSLTAGSFQNHTKVWTFSSCTFTFLVEKDKFNFSIDYLEKKSLREFRRLGLTTAIDWTIGYNTCDTAKNEPNFACHNNSECYKPESPPHGYRCRCLKGYEGNPYSINGCTDINECKEETSHQCARFATCQNTQGNYTCSCQDGYNGDGWKSGTMCTPSHDPQSSRIKIVAVVVGTIVCTFALVVCSSKLYSEYKKRALKKHFFKQNGGYKLPKELKKRRGSTAVKIYTSEELEKATNCYDREIHQGGYNTLYEGLLEEAVNNNDGSADNKKNNNSDGNADQTNENNGGIADQKNENNDGSKEIGQGCFGKIFRRIQDKDTKVKTKVAVQKFKMHALSNESNKEFVDVVDQFIEEVVIVSQINHKNVVKLLGCCLETEDPSLVYQYISNENLFKQINDKTKRSNLSWQQRLKIAEETAEVLWYLHFQITDPIIHGDVKSANILLDIDNSNSIAKVTGFESSSFVVPHENKSSMRPYQGTPGYCDPELPEKGLTIKSDVYSFGVVLVELLTGKVATSFNNQKEEDTLADFLSLPKVDGLSKVIDKDIIKEENKVQLEKVADLAKRCLNSNGANRPTMKDITMELAGIQKDVVISQRKEEFSVVASQPPPHDQFNPVEAVHVHQESVTDVGPSMPSPQELNLEEIGYGKYALEMD